jgi:serine/threonine-protein kinase
MPDASDISALSRLLDTALAMPPAQRARWLSSLRGGDRNLQSMLRRLLTEHDSPRHANFLRSLPRLPPSPQDQQAEPRLSAGERIGPYRLLHELGRGGMGTVWLAERADGSYTRRVALKLPRVERDPGSAQRLVLERDIAAPLEHPHIARLYDAGIDAQGRPYLALQYIEGLPIDRFCREQNLSVRDRLRLFLQVAGAVAYAHGHLVVHRDIKPSNILVSRDRQAHLLDFGIAVPLRQAAIASTITAGLTPNYAAPEQVAGGPVTVASDIYSLGVLLHELVTGALPTARDRLPLPTRKQVPDGFARELRGDLQAIVAKALRHDAAQRYPSADAFADDVQRFLACEPIRARPASLLYRTCKAVQRHRFEVSTLALATASVLAAAAVAWSQARQATEAAERAVLERGARLVGTRFQGQPELQAGSVRFLGRCASVLREPVSKGEFDESTSIHCGPAQGVARAGIRNKFVLRRSGRRLAGH